jgi:hypothetical protein
VRVAGEDDLVHAGTAQLLCALLSEHPARGVDEVRFARAVGSDDRRDARLEDQARPLGERLEAEEIDAL